MQHSPLDKFARRTLLSVLVGSVVAIAASPAFADPGPRVRGTVVSLGANSLVVKTREGPDVTIALTSGWGVNTVVKVALADVKPGDYVGIASIPGATSDSALEVLVFPPKMAGSHEGSFDWDLKPASSMTNGSVSSLVKDVQGASVNVTYKGQSKKLAIPPGTPIVTFAPATPGDVKPGAAVFVSTDKAADGQLSAGRVVVGKDGVVPPM